MNSDNIASSDNNKLLSLLTGKDQSSMAAIEPSLSQYAVGAPALGYSMWTILLALQDWLDVTANDGMLAVASMAATNSELSLDASNNQAAILEYDNEQVTAAADDDDSNALQKAQSQYSTDQAAYQIPVTTFQGLSQLLSQLQTTVAQAESLVGGTASAIASQGRSWGTGS
jgi:hypothetical protein